MHKGSISLMKNTVNILWFNVISITNSIIIIRSTILNWNYNK